MKLLLLKDLFFYFGVSVFITCISIYVGADFLFGYLKGSIIGLLFTMLAINAAGLGIIISKMKGVLHQFPKINFSSSIKQMKLSFLEQIILIIISLLSLILFNGTNIIIPYSDAICNVVLLMVLIYGVSILWDTWNSVFIIIGEIQELYKNNIK